MFKIAWTEDGESFEELTSSDEVSLWMKDLNPTLTEVSVDEVTTEELIEYVHMELESENYHSLTSMPDDINEILQAVCGPILAHRVMYELVDRGLFMPN